MTLLGGAAVARSRLARAQQPAMPVVGFLGTRASGDDPQLLTAFRRGLEEAGYIEGQNVAINTASRRINMIASQHWQPISFAVRWP
jgi:putative ABC transport system substrate-binding protein